MHVWMQTFLLWQQRVTAAVWKAVRFPVGYPAVPKRRSLWMLPRCKVVWTESKIRVGSEGHSSACALYRIAGCAAVMQVCVWDQMVCWAVYSEGRCMVRAAYDSAGWCIGLLAK